ncbi:MAG: hypothetical protein ACYTG4_05650 [Planctomycetota bacterium]|jgi:ABC-type siderophore export system fused ATPase/permease subunit
MPRVVPAVLLALLSTPVITVAAQQMARAEEPDEVGMARIEPAVQAPKDAETVLTENLANGWHELTLHAPRDVRDEVLAFRVCEPPRFDEP